MKPRFIYILAGLLNYKNIRARKTCFEQINKFSYDEILSESDFVSKQDYFKIKYINESFQNLSKTRIVKLM